MFSGLTASLYDAVMAAGGLFCQQLPDRSPHLFGLQSPLCWRCSGITLGAPALLFYLLRWRALPSSKTSFLLALMLPLDVIGAILGLWPGSNAVRFITGALWGFFGTSAAFTIIARTLWRTSSGQRSAEVDAQ